MFIIIIIVVVIPLKTKFNIFTRLPERLDKLFS